MRTIVRFLIPIMLLAGAAITSQSAEAEVHAHETMAEDTQKPAAATSQHGFAAGNAISSQNTSARAHAYSDAAQMARTPIFAATAQQSLLANKLATTAGLSASQDCWFWGLWCSDSDDSDDDGSDGSGDEDSIAPSEHGHNHKIFMRIIIKRSSWSNNL